MSLYPSLEDMKVDHLARAQAQTAQVHSPQHPQPHGVAVAPSAPLPYPIQPSSAPAPEEKYSNLYPSLNEYMGLAITPEMIAQHSPHAVAISPPAQVALPSNTSSNMIAPLSGSSLGLARANVTHGIREITLCKGGNGKIGLKVEAVNKGIFITLVQQNSPAALGGLRFGDQILQVNDVLVAGFSASKVYDIIKKSKPEKIVLAVRDRPFERTVTLHKSSTGHIGFGFKNGKITTLVKDSSAARNGLLTEHNLLEVNGQNVVGIKDKDITKIIEEGGQVITVTVMPAFVYEHMMKHIASSLVKKTMDHSIPDV